MSSSAALCLTTAWDAAPRTYLQVCPPPEASAGTTPETWRETLVAMLPALRRRALTWCRGGAEAEDLAQETLLRALSGTAVFGSEQHLRAWLYTVLRNLFISRRRSRRSELKACARLEGAAESNRAREANASQFLTSSVERALEALPPPFARVVQLVDLEEYSYGEASDALGIPVGTVMSRLFRARRRLAEALAEPSL